MPPGSSCPATLRDTFQGTDGFGDALDEASAETAAIERYVTAADARPTAPDLVTQVGLWGSTPEVDLAAARTAFAAGDLEGTAQSADSALSIWTTADDVGQGRLVSIVAIALAFLVALALVAMSLRARRHRRREVAYAASMSRPVKRADGPPDRPVQGSVVRYTRRHSGRAAKRRGPRCERHGSWTGLMGMRRPRPSAEILSGDSADVYFARAESILRQEGLDPIVTMEVFTRQEAVLCGIDEAKNLLGHVLASADPGGDAARGPERRRSRGAQGDRAADPSAVSPVRPVRDRVPGHARPVDRLGDGRARVRRDGGARIRSSASGRGTSIPDITDVLDYAAIVGGCVGCVHAGRRPTRRPGADRHDAALAGPHLR